jgi:hypothetical protein
MPMLSMMTSRSSFFHLREDHAGILDPRAGRCIDVQPDLSGIHQRKEVLAHPGRDECRTADHQQER